MLEHLYGKKVRTLPPKIGEPYTDGLTLMLACLEQFEFKLFSILPDLSLGLFLKMLVMILIPMDLHFPAEQTLQAFLQTMAYPFRCSDVMARHLLS